jgi:DNA-binding NtrC family response regulator
MGGFPGFADHGRGLRFFQHADESAVRGGLKPLHAGAGSVRETIEVNMDDSLRVLLVDDEESYLRIAAKVFGRSGFEVVSCSVGRDVVGLLAERECQVVVLDLKMPGMTGREVLREIKGRFPDVQVIILTGHASSDDAAACLTGGAFDFLIKPVEMEHLMDRVRSAYAMWRIATGRQGD